MNLMRLFEEQFVLYREVESVMNAWPDVEAIFEFNGTRKSPVVDGYRPAHLVNENYLTTGTHHYYDIEEVLPDGTTRGTITFLTPEDYPHCLWVGKKIAIQEGARVVGYATITNIYNPLLEQSEDCPTDGQSGDGSVIEPKIP